MSADDAGVLTAYGKALGPLLVMALRPLQADPQAYLTLMNGVSAGVLRLQLVTDIPVKDQPGTLVLYVIGADGKAQEISRLQLNGGNLN